MTQVTIHQAKSARLNSGQLLLAQVTGAPDGTPLHTHTSVGVSCGACTSGYMFWCGGYDLERSHAEAAFEILFLVSTLQGSDQKQKDGRPLPFLVTPDDPRWPRRLWAQALRRVDSCLDHLTDCLPLRHACQPLEIICPTCALSFLRRQTLSTTAHIALGVRDRR